MAEVFASPKPKHPPYLSSRKLAATSKAFKYAPQNELAAINAVLTAIISELNAPPVPTGGLNV
jgi:hypothetical protein